MTMTIALDELTDLLGRAPVTGSSGTALLDCGVCGDAVRWTQSTGAVVCLGVDNCSPELIIGDLRYRSTRERYVQPQVLAEGEPPVCDDIEKYRHDARSCLPCSTRQGWVALKAKEALRPPPVEWSFTDLAAIDLSAVPVNPTIGRFAEGKALFRAGALNGLHGKPGSGKTWALYLAMAQETIKGNYVLLLDWEMGAREAAVALHSLGGDLTKVLYPEIEGTLDAANLRARYGTLPVTLVGIDSVGEAMSAAGLDGYNDGDTARWYAEVPKALLSIWPASAVVLVDHLPKAVPAGMELFPIGSQRKLAAVTTQYLVRTLVEFSRTVDGRAALICAKDRGGSYLRGDEVSMLNGGPSGFTLYEATSVDKAAVAEHSLRTAVIEAVIASPGISSGDLKAAVTGRATEIVAMITTLTEDGILVLSKDGNKKTYTISGTYVQIDLGNR